MAHIPLWSGSLKLSLVLIPVKMLPASEDSTLGFHQIHQPSGERIKYKKGIQTPEGFEEVPDNKIIKGYEYEKGKYVYVRPKEFDELKLPAKHTIELVRFVDRYAIDPRYLEKPYYLVPDGDESADEGYAVIHKALAETGKCGIGQIITQGREHLVAISAFNKGLMLERLRYAGELRPADVLFDQISDKADPEAVKLAKQLIESESGAFEPKKMPDEFAVAVRKLVDAKLKNQRLEMVEPEAEAQPKVVNIMAALKKSMEQRKPKPRAAAAEAKRPARRSERKRR